MSEENSNTGRTVDDNCNFYCFKETHPVYKHTLDSFADVLKILLKISPKINDSSATKFEEYIFDINSKFEEIPDIARILNNLKIDQPVLFTFQTSDVKRNAFIFWKTSSDHKFKSLNLDGISAEFCRKFLGQEIIKGRSGILDVFKSRSKLDLRHIGSENKRNLLILASINNQKHVVENLIEHNLDVDHKDISGCNAIEKAWENYLKDGKDKGEAKEIMVKLLQANSKFPRASYTINAKELHFDYNMAPDLVKRFIIKCENLHDMSTLSEYDKIEEELAKEPHMKYFYNRINKSLMAHAISSGKLAVCKLLISLRVSIGQHEVNDLDNLYKMLDDPQKTSLQSEHRLNAIELPKSHISTLLQLSKIARNDRQYEEHWKCIEDAFKTIDTDESCSKILKIAAIFKMFTIYFDFDHDIVYYLDPKSNSGSLAKIYDVNIIYIGAKHLLDDDKKYEVYGAIIHELCHFAVFIAYLNCYNPYRLGGSSDEDRYTEVVEQCIENRAIEEDIVGSVLNYDKEQQHSEFIVRAVQMQMHYYDQVPFMASKNSALLQERREKFDKLFTYYKEVVEKDFDDLLEIFRDFLDDSQDTTFDQLTGPWKAFVLHSNINFQGQATTFFDVIEDDHKILSLMTSKQIRRMLWDGQSIDIADEIESNEGFHSSERSFIDFNNNETVKMKEEIKDFDQILSFVENSQVFVLADAPGAGKTTAFKCLAYALKFKYENKWVSMIELRKFQNIFKKYDQHNLTIEEILTMLLEIIKLEALEVEIFKNLFFNNKAILLFDAIDEISPNFNNFIINVLLKIQETTQNQIFVSTRPQHAKQLSEKLKVKPFKLVPFSWKEKESFILEMLKESPKYDESMESEVLNDFRVFFKSIKNIGYFNYDIDNPLMVKIITELYLDGQIDLKSQSLDLYEIFEKIEMSHKEQVDTRIAFRDRDPFSTISLESVHQALALILLSSLHSEELKQTYIIGIWNENKKDLTAERIQRYGFVRIGHDFKDNDNFTLDFTHRTYAEFFVAKFILTFMFKIEDYMKDEELEKVMKIIKLFVNLDIIDNIFGFIMCYMKNEAEGRRFVLKNRVKKLILKEFCEMKNELSFDPADEQLLFLRFFSVFFIREQAALNDFWLLDKEQNMLRMILIETRIFGNFFKLQNLMETLSISFGANWHEKFNRSLQNLVKDEEIEEVEGSQNYSVKTYNRNLYKFLDYFEKNFTDHEKVTVCKNDVFVSENVELIEMNLMTKMLSIYAGLSKKHNQILIDILISFIKYTTDVDILSYLADKLENLLNSNAESIREVLFYDYEREHHPIFKAIKFKNLELFHKFKDLYNSYKASEDSMKNLFFSNNNLLYLILLTPNKMFTEISAFVNEVYKPDYAKFIQSLEPRSDLKVLSLVFEDKKKFKSFKKFILAYYNDNQTKTKQVINHLLTFGHLSFCAPLLPAIRKRNVVQFRNNLEIYDQYGISWSQVTNLNIIIHISMELFLNMTRETYKEYKKFLSLLYDVNKDHVEEPKLLHTFRSIGHLPAMKSFENKSTNLIAKCVYHFKLELLWNEDKFYYFEKFLFEYFGDDEDQAKAIINNILFCNEYSSVDLLHPFVRPAEKANPYEFNRIISLYEKYKSSDEELRNMFKTTSIFCYMFFVMTNEIYPTFLKFLQNTFYQVEEEVLECINRIIIYKSIGDGEKFIFLKKFISDFSRGDEILKTKIMRKILFFKYGGEVYPILKILQRNNIDSIKEVYSLYLTYKVSDEEVQDMFKRGSFLISIFNRVTEDSYEIVVNFIKEVFGTNLELLKELINENCVNYNCNYVLKSRHEFKLFENFVIDIFGDNQPKARECIKHILLCQDTNPIKSIIIEKNLDELKFHIDMLRKYPESLKEIQEKFIKHEISSIVFTNYMSDEMYEVLKRFLLDIFSSDLRSFKRFIKVAEISEIIKNEEKFKLFENLIFEYFENNELLSSDLINSILYTSCDQNPIEINQDTPIYQFDRIKNIYIKYKNSWSELFDKLSQLPEDIFDPLSEFMKQVFESNEELIIKCLGKEHRHEIIGNIDNFNSFKAFLARYFKSSHDQFLEEFLHTEYEDSPHLLLSIIGENDLFKCSSATSIYSSYPDALRTVLMTSNLLFKIISCLGDKSYDSFLDLLKIVFTSDKSEITVCMNVDAEHFDFWKKQNIEKYHKFLKDYFEDDTAPEKFFLQT